MSHALFVSRTLAVNITVADNAGRLTFAAQSVVPAFQCELDTVACFRRQASIWSLKGLIFSLSVNRRIVSVDEMRLFPIARAEGAAKQMKLQSKTPGKGQGPIQRI